MADLAVRTEEHISSRALRLGVVQNEGKATAHPNKTKRTPRSIAASLMLAVAACLAVPATVSHAQDYVQAVIDAEALFAQLAELRADVAEAQGASAEHERAANRLRPQLVDMRQTFAQLQGDATELLVERHGRGISLSDQRGLLEFTSYAGATGRQLQLGTDVTRLIANQQTWDEEEGAWSQEYRFTTGMYEMAGDIRALWQYVLDYQPAEYLLRLGE